MIFILEFALYLIAFLIGLNIVKSIINSCITHYFEEKLNYEKLKKDL